MVKTSHCYSTINSPDYTQNYKPLITNNSNCQFYGPTVVKRLNEVPAIVQMAYES